MFWRTFPACLLAGRRSVSAEWNGELRHSFGNSNTVQWACCIACVFFWDRIYVCVCARIHCVLYCICVCIHLYVYMCARWYVCVYICRSEDNTGCFPRPLFTLFFQKKVSHWTWSSLICLGWWPASSRNLPVSTSPALRLWTWAITPRFLGGCWKSDLRFSCLWDKPSPD